MKKLIRGIVEFRNKVRPDFKETFMRLALGQRPDALFIACSDSRVVPNLFASSDPGDLFVIRNVGNLVPDCNTAGTPRDSSEAAAIDFALHELPIADIIVCGHSECGAMLALARGREQLDSAFLRSWLRHADGSVQRMDSGILSDGHLERHNRLSRANVLEQIEHLKTYPLVREKIQAGRLRLHGWWFDIKEAEVFAYDAGEGGFRLIDEEYARCLLAEAED